MKTAREPHPDTMADTNDIQTNGLTMNWKKTPPIDCKVQSLVCFLTIENNSGAEIHRPLGTDYREENVMNLKNVRR